MKCVCVQCFKRFEGRNVAQELRHQIAGVPPSSMDLGQACEHLFRYMRLAGKRAYERPTPARTWRRLPIAPKP